MFSLKGRRVLVTASSRGIGFGSAKAFLEEGSRVVICSSNHDRLSQAEKQLGTLGEVHALAADLRLESDLDKLVDQTLERLGGLDHMVYVAPPPPPGTFMANGYKEWREAAESMMVSPAYLCKRVGEEMVKSKTRGTMVLVASVAVREPIPTIATSGVARIAVSGIVRTLARELGPSGIRVNGVMPGYVDTDRVREILEATGARTGLGMSKARESMESEIPLRRIGTTEETANVILFLSSDLASYVSGAMVPVDGAILRSVG
ncbi:MAG TPA: SDR family oxidoreductase [Nitrososphaerales archaeon]|nr:SDR family oxidoreductase [Nitrososphaerales archaeon]